MKDYYVQEINDLMRDCDDISLLDLIHALLKKQVTSKEKALA